MRAAPELTSRVFRPGKWAPLRGKPGGLQMVWAGFARREILRRGRGGGFVGVHADRFAGRPECPRDLLLDDIPHGHAVRGLVEKSGPKPLIKIITRASPAADFAHFGHPRIPLLEPPLFSCPTVPITDAKPARRLRGSRMLADLAGGWRWRGVIV